MMGRASEPIVVTREDRAVLERWIRTGSTPQRVVTRARIVLLSTASLSNRTIASRLSISAHTVQLWRERYQAGGTAALRQDAPGRGRKTTLRAEAIARVQALLSAPREDGRKWTVRDLAHAAGISRAMADRLRRFVTKIEADAASGARSPRVQS